MMFTKKIALGILVLLLAFGEAWGEENAPGDAAGQPSKDIRAVPPGPPGSNVVVAMTTTVLSELEDGVLKEVAKVPKGAFLMVIEAPQTAKVTEHLVFVEYDSPTIGVKRGWLDPGATRNYYPRFSRLDEISVLFRIKNAHAQWKTIQDLVNRADKEENKIHEPYLARAKLWALLHNHDEALKDYLTAVRIIAAENPGDLVKKASSFELLRKAIEQHNETPEPRDAGQPKEHYGSAVHAFRTGKLQYAVKQFTDAIELDRDNPLYYYYRAVTYMSMSEQSLANKDVKQAASYEADARRDVVVGSGHERNLLYYQRRQIDSGLHFVQGELRTWLQRIRLGDPHYDPYGDVSLPPEFLPDPQLRRLIERWSKLTPEVKKEIVKMTEGQ